MNKETIERIDLNKVLPDNFRLNQFYKEDWKRINIAILKIIDISQSESQGNLQKSQENMASG